MERGRIDFKRGSYSVPAVDFSSHKRPKMPTLDSQDGEKVITGKFLRLFI